MYGQACDDAVVAPLSHVDAATPWPKSGIILDLLHQREHLLGAVSQKY